ncbi:MAG: tetrathionate reductase family octaheme c-type cytochrome [Syntrophales bacterium]
MKCRTIAVIAILGMTVCSAALAGTNHADFITGRFKSGPEVTAKCLECHQKQAGDFMKTPHWTWSDEQVVNGQKRMIGKKNVINNFCIAVPSNWARCTVCHAGYGYKNDSYDFTKAENVDCLACHDTTGTYTKVFPEVAPDPKVDLTKVAQSVGRSSRKSCGSCHFYGGGGGHIKHGDLDSSMTNPTAEIDVHMGGNAKMTCTDCHKTKNHLIRGESLLISQGDKLRVQCTDCHDKPEIHKNAALNRHVNKVACQTCHIPTIAKTLPTKVWWDWSKAGQDLKPEKDAFGMETYAKIKGEFRWNKDFAPEYFWYNGKVSRTLPGDKIDPNKVVEFNRPLGDRSDPNARITPFKVMRGKQPYDAGNNTMAYVHLFGGYWKHFNWGKAIEDGMKTAGMPYSGKYGFVETRMVWRVNHMVVPKAKALKCMDCHGTKGRLDWKALGYDGDPMKKK